MRKLRILLLMSGVIMLLSCMGCLGASDSVRMIPLQIGKQTFTVEVADTMEKQITGLMYRKSITADFGMLFVYNEESDHGFWMKNTLIPLDIIYINGSRQIVDMYINVPPCRQEPCETYNTRVPAQYVLELRGNRVKELNIKIGDMVSFILD